MGGMKTLTSEQRELLDKVISDIQDVVSEYQKRKEFGGNLRAFRPLLHMGARIRSVKAEYIAQFGTRSVFKDDFPTKMEDDPNRPDLARIDRWLRNNP